MRICFAASPNQTWRCFPYGVNDVERTKAHAERHFGTEATTRHPPEPDHSGASGPWSGELGSAREGGLRTAGMMRWLVMVREIWCTDEMFQVMDFRFTASPDEHGPRIRHRDAFSATCWVSLNAVNRILTEIALGIAVSERNDV
ncbi:MAG: hypothetical protein ACR2QF_16320 [Geminicoccaceae bacterium]